MASTRLSTGILNIYRFSLKLNNATKIIGNLPATKKYLAEMVKAGYVNKIRNNLYTCHDFALNSDCANRFQIASSINENSYISYHSAFEFYGFYNQMFNEIQFSSSKRFKKKASKKRGYRTINNLRNRHLAKSL